MVDNQNSKHINHINQLLHNKGIKQEDRIGVLTSLFEKRKSLTVGSAAVVMVDPRFSDIIDAINAIDFTNKEISQEIFMLFGSKLTRYKLDQFYTPLTISEFITGMMIPGKAAVDPAGGTGDLLVHYNGNIHIWDIDEHALELCRFNYELNMKKDYQIKCANSLIIGNHDTAAAFDYVTMNPPFGSSTVITDDTILQHYELGLGRKKQEIGILFLELGLKLCKPDGILFAIVPAGYVGNTTKPCMDLRGLLLRHRVIASIELPKQSFKRSGTGVNTYILMIQKKATAVAAAATTETTEPYPICISTIDNIGYELTKANTPIKYKIIRETGEVCMKDGNKVIDNDLVDCASRLAVFARDFNIPNMTMHDGASASASASASAYESVMSGSLHHLILDVKRYSSKYLSLVTKLKSTPGCVPIHKLAKLVLKTTKIDQNKQYKYIDIGEISTPLYGSKELYGWELPSRAKYSLQKYDILISKLEGNVSYCVILDDSDNYISTNGVSVIRPNDMNALYVLFANITKKEFIVQHNAYLTGSIMASLCDSDIGETLMDTQIDVEMTKKMIDALTALNALRL
jgi:predicted RNA methylase